MTHEPPLLPTGEMQGKKKRKQQQHRIPFTMLRRSVLLMDTQASLEAKRTPDVWEGSPTLK